MRPPWGSFAGKPSTKTDSKPYTQQFTVLGPAGAPMRIPWGSFAGRIPVIPVVPVGIPSGRDPTDMAIMAYGVTIDANAKLLQDTADTQGFFYIDKVIGMRQVTPRQASALYPTMINKIFNPFFNVVHVGPFNIVDRF
jgi:hypothetical protein